MGYSTTAEVHDKIEKLRSEGRLCQGPSRHDCLTRAQYQITQTSWTYKVAEGPSKIHSMVMCTKHARQFPVGYVGVNFIVDAVSHL